MVFTVFMNRLAMKKGPERSPFRRRLRRLSRSGGPDGTGRWAAPAIIFGVNALTRAANPDLLHRNISQKS
jgi:hypothetical protein